MIIDDLGDELRRFTTDMNYYCDHREELLRRYPNKWIGIYDQEVVGVADDARELLNRVREWRRSCGFFRSQLGATKSNRLIALEDVEGGGDAVRVALDSQGVLCGFDGGVVFEVDFPGDAVEGH